MSDGYTKLHIDLSLLNEPHQATAFDKPHVVEIQRKVTPRYLVQAIIDEFNEVTHLIRDPAAYYLDQGQDGTRLDDNDPLLEQLGNQYTCRLVEVEQEFPPHAQPMHRRIYLREQGSNRVIRLAWQPAIIGRSDEKLSDNDLIACKLSNYNVSRRHAQIVIDGQQVLIESLAPKNPLHVISPNTPPIPVNGRYPIKNGDTIELVRSKIKLQVIIF